MQQRLIQKREKKKAGVKTGLTGIVINPTVIAAIPGINALAMLIFARAARRVTTIAMRVIRGAIVKAAVRKAFPGLFTKLVCK